MRQIRICAWLAFLMVPLTACSGEKFSTGPQSGSSTGGPSAIAAAGAAESNHSGTSGNVAAEPPTQGGSATGSDTPAGPDQASGGDPAIVPSLAGSAGSSAGGSSMGLGSGGASSGGGGGDSLDACADVSVTFRMLPSADLAHDYLCDAGCGTGWLTITDADGATAYSLFAACGTASCDSCEVQGCAAAACLPIPLSAEGSHLVWNGTYQAKSTCGANMTCQKPRCVKPGRYKAKACAAINGGNSSNSSGCVPLNDQLCAEAEFELPSTQTVKLVLKR